MEELIKNIDPKIVYELVESVCGSEIKELTEELKRYKKMCKALSNDNDEYRKRIEKAIEIIESYNLGKYDYSIPLGGIDELLETLKGEENGDKNEKKV